MVPWSTLNRNALHLRVCYLCGGLSVLGVAVTSDGAFPAQQHGGSFPGSWYVPICRQVLIPLLTLFVTQTPWVSAHPQRSATTLARRLHATMAARGERPAVCFQRPAVVIRASRAGKCCAVKESALVDKIDAVDTMDDLTHVYAILYVFDHFSVCPVGFLVFFSKARGLWNYMLCAPEDCVSRREMSSFYRYCIGLYNPKSPSY